MSGDAPPSVTVRSATPADTAALGRLGAVMVNTHHAFDPARFIPPSPHTEQGYGSFLASQITAKNAFVLVAEVADEVVAYSYAGIEGIDYMSLRGPAGVLYDIVVDARAREHGIGRQLLTATLANLKARGANQVVLSTAEQNEAAQRLFAKAGFRRTMIEMTIEM